MCKVTSAMASGNTAAVNAKQDPKTMKLAATPDNGLSPTLIKAHADYTHSSLTSWAFVTLCTASFYLGPLILLSPIALYFFHPQAAAMIFCTNLFLAFYPISPWPKFRKVCQLFYSPFNFHHNILEGKMDELSRKKNELSIIAMHPHAIIPLHGFVWGAICDQLLPHLYGYGCTTDGALILPILRHMLFWISAGSANKKKVLTEMQVNGQNLFILPGGVAEIFLSHKRHQANDLPYTQTIKARRYGLMKLALQTGAVIYPSFVFGISDVLDQLAHVDKHNDDESDTKYENNGGNDGGQTTKKKKGNTTILNKMGNVMEAISRKIGGGLTLYYGQYYLPIPYNPQLSLVLGNPIYPVPIRDDDDNNGKPTTMKNLNGEKRTCERIENPTSEQVEELMGRYVEALQCLFEQYKVEAGYPNDTLRII